MFTSYSRVYKRLLSFSLAATMKALLLSLLLLPLGCASTTLNGTYSTYQDAKVNGVIAHKFFPKPIPPSAKNIEFSYVKYAGKAVSTFQLEESEMKKFIPKLTKTSNTKPLYKFEGKHNHWFVSINSSSGNVRFIKE